MKYLEENVTKVFSHEEPALEFFKKIDAASIWQRVFTHELEAVGLVNAPILLEEIKKNTPFAKDVSDESIMETVEGIGLAVNIPTENGMQLFPLANSGMSSIMARAGYGIDSSSLRRTATGKTKRAMETEKKAKALNYGLEISGDQSLVYIFDEKIRAVHSGDPYDYVRFPFSELSSAFKEGLKDQFKKVFFAESAVNYMFSTIAYLIEDPEIIKNINDVFMKAGIDVSQMKTSVRLVSSDIGESGANIYPCLLSASRRYIALGTPLSLTHKNKHTIDDFKANVQQVVSMFKDSAEKIEALENIRLKHPAGCLLRLAKQCGLSKKLAYERSEEFAGLFGAQATFLDAWWELNDIYDQMIDNDKTPESKRILLQEQIARVIFSPNVEEYDIPFVWE